MKNREVLTRTRDKNLLIFLGVIVVLFVIYYFLLSPALDKASALKAERKSLSSELQRVQTTVEQLPANRKKAADDLAALTEKYKQFFYEPNQERLLYRLDQIIEASGLSLDGYAQTKPVAKSIDIPDVVYAPLQYPLLEQAAVINEELAKAAAADAKADDKSPAKNASAPDQVAVSYLSLDFSDTTYQNFFSFVKSLEDFDRGIIIENIYLQKNKTGTALSGQVVLGIYSLAKPNESESNDLEFTPALPKGKADPFQ